MAGFVAGVHLPKIAAKIYKFCERTKPGDVTELTRRAKSGNTDSEMLKDGARSVFKFRKFETVWVFARFMKV